MNSLMSSLMSFLKLQKIPTFFLVISRLSLGLPVLRLFSASWWDLNQSVRYFSGENLSMGGPLILINRIQLVISMDNPLRYSARLLEGDNFKNSHFPMLTPTPPYFPYNTDKYSG
jgi:hypothetical protein